MVFIPARNRLPFGTVIMEHQPDRKYNYEYFPRDWCFVLCGLMTVELCCADLKVLLVTPGPRVWLTKLGLDADIETEISLACCW